MGKVRYQVVENDGYQTVDEIHKVVVHFFSVGDVDDPDIYAAAPIWEWQQTPAGQFVMKHAYSEPIFQKTIDQLTYGYKYAIIAELEKKKLTEFYLKFGKQI